MKIPCTYPKINAENLKNLVGLQPTYLLKSRHQLAKEFDQHRFENNYVNSEVYLCFDMHSVVPLQQFSQGRSHRRSDALYLGPYEILCR